jgi:hypothetical protein
LSGGPLTEISLQHFTHELHHTSLQAPLLAPPRVGFVDHRRRSVLPSKPGKRSIYRSGARFLSLTRSIATRSVALAPFLLRQFLEFGFIIIIIIII